MTSSHHALELLSTWSDPTRGSLNTYAYSSFFPVLRPSAFGALRRPFGFTFPGVSFMVGVVFFIVLSGKAIKVGFRHWTDWELPSRNLCAYTVGVIARMARPLRFEVPLTQEVAQPVHPTTNRLPRHPLRPRSLPRSKLQHSWISPTSRPRRFLRRL